MRFFKWIPESVYTVLIGAFLTLLAEKTSPQKIVDILEIIPWYTYAAAVIVILFLLMIIDNLRKRFEIKIYRICEKKFEDLAQDSAVTDSNLFQLLFLDISQIIREDDAVHTALLQSQTIVDLKQKAEAAQNAVLTEIQAILNKAADLMLAFCGHKCTVTVKLYNGKFQAQNIRGKETQVACISTVYIDERSARNDAITQLVDETPFAKMHDNKAEFFMEKKIKKLKNYRDSDFENFGQYNSLVVVPIKELPLKKNKAGYVQIDSEDGHIVSETVRHYAMELSWRLAIMLKRYSEIQAEMAKFYKVGAADAK